MAEAAAAKRYAVVTGANKGIGFGICKQLASHGITVLLTARDETRGLEAVENLREFGFSDRVIFHQLDITDPASIATLENFINTHFGKLDILVNNAGILGSTIDGDALKAFGPPGERGENIDWNKVTSQTSESAEAGVRTNFYGAKGMCEALIHLLKLSDSPRIVNVSSGGGKLEKIPSGWAKDVLSDVESLTEEKLDEVLNQFLKDFKENALEAKGWPTVMPAYTVSKAALNAYTRILANKFPSFCINAVCPGYVKTDINNNTGIFSVDEGAECIVKLALLPDGGPSGLFFYRSQVDSF
ncbi:hypothetical protein L6164_003845 [Bauhinia variegata]|uniref:Uncharacterized protein n=1 Tax=Bauhinia variegata TaxID=167791 RepID=A0ACB9Q2L6_BAUVA|nr:hypothetical protein L6164_003845 [Bauhinia variegata]